MLKIEKFDYDPALKSKPSDFFFVRRNRRDAHFGFGGARIIFRKSIFMAFIESLFFILQ